MRFIARFLAARRAKRQRRFDVWCRRERVVFLKKPHHSTQRNGVQSL